jgi:hypothetical protein
MCAATGVTAQQRQAMLGLGDTVAAARTDFAGSVSLLRSLESSMVASVQNLEERMGHLGSVLAPRQIARFLQWVESSNVLSGSLSVGDAAAPASSGAASEIASTVSSKEARPAESKGASSKRRKI